MMLECRMMEIQLKHLMLNAPQNQADLLSLAHHRWIYTLSIASTAALKSAKMIASAHFVVALAIKYDAMCVLLG